MSRTALRPLRPSGPELRQPYILLILLIPYPSRARCFARTEVRFLTHMSKKNMSRFQ